MKRKTILSFITGLFLLGGLSSCMDLDETVYDKLPADDFGQSTAELNALIGNSHNTMKKFWTEYMHLSECSGSMAVTPTRRGGDWYDGGLWQNLFLHNWGTKNDLVKGSWDYLYKVIAQTNQSLDKLKEILENNPENISVPKYISEVRAFRAMYYILFIGYVCSCSTGYFFFSSNGRCSTI